MCLGWTIHFDANETVLKMMRYFDANDAWTVLKVDGRAKVDGLEPN